MLPLLSPHIAAALLLCADPITRVTVNQVRIDAVVTDSKGNLVRDLKSEDFRVFQDGKRQKPVHVQFVPGGDGVAQAKPNRELQENQVKRTIVVVLDDAGMSFESFSHSRQAIRQYLDRAMQPGDLVAVLRTLQSSSYLNPFMSDPAAVRLALDQMRYTPPPTHGRFRSVFPLLRSVLTALNRMPGRKSLILFSDSMRIPTDSPIDPFLIYRQLADSALRASVTIYGIDSRGLTSRMLIPVESPVANSGVGPPGTSNHSHRGQSAREEKNDAAEAHLQQQINDALSPVDANFPPRTTDPRLRGGAFPQTEHPPSVGDLDGLNFLANETGGLMLQDNNDLGSELQKALDDQGGYYLVAWNPGEKTFAPSHGTFADFHNITVKLTRPGLTARTSHGFYGRDTGVIQSDRSAKIAMQEALLSPFQTGRFDAQMTSGFHLRDGRGYIRSFVFINGKDIVFTPHPDSRRNDCYAIHLEFLTLPQPIDSSVETLAESQITSLEMCGTSYEDIAHRGLALTMLHPVDKPGGYLMRMAVRNVVQGDNSSLAGSDRLVIREEGDRPVGSAHQLVEVPEWWSAPAVFGLRLQAEKLPADVVRPRMEGETDRNMSVSYRPAVGEDPSLRHFRAGEKLQYDARIVNVTDAVAKIRIVRDDDTEVYSGHAQSVHEDRVTGSYVIDSSLGAGSYDLQLVVTGKDAKGQPYRGVEAIDFELP